MDPRRAAMTPPAVEPTHHDDAIERALAGGAATPEDLAERAGLSVSAVISALHRLRARGKATSTGERWRMK